MTIYKLNEELSIVANWFYSIAKIADDKKNANDIVMSDHDAFLEIKSKALLCADYVKNYLLI